MRKIPYEYNDQIETWYDVYVMSILSNVDFIKSTFDKIDITYINQTS